MSCPKQCGTCRDFEPEFEGCRTGFCTWEPPGGHPAGVSIVANKVRDTDGADCGFYQLKED